MRPVVTAASDDPDTFRLDMDCQAIAVPLHLEHPIRAFRRDRLQERQARLDALGHRVERKIGLCRIARPGRFGLGDGIVLQQRFGTTAHLVARFSAATDFRKASMMLTTLLGDDEGAVLPWAFCGFNAFSWLR